MPACLPACLCVLGMGHHGGGSGFLQLASTASSIHPFRSAPALVQECQKDLNKQARDKRPEAPRSTPAAKVCRQCKQVGRLGHLWWRHSFMGGLASFIMHHGLLAGAPSWAMACCCMESLLVA